MRMYYYITLEFIVLVNQSMLRKLEQLRVRSSEMIRITISDQDHSDHGDQRKG